MGDNGIPTSLAIIIAAPVLGGIVGVLILAGLVASSVIG